MQISSLYNIVCPKSKSQLELQVKDKEGDIIIEGKLICKKCKKVYNIQDEIADFTYPENLKASDREFNEKYQENAILYDEGMAWLFSSFFENEENIRTKLVNFLNIKPKDFILNMGCGSGSDSKFILHQLGKDGKLFNFDLSANLLKISQEKVSNEQTQIEYFIGNGSYLPFTESVFDSLFHFGGINIFSEKKKAIAEMARVVKPGGIVVFGDESAAPWLNKKEYGKILINANPLYKHQPPLELLPDNAQDVSLNYILGNSFYVIVFTVGETVKLNLDLPIPGKRGGTLRSRYDASMNKFN